MLTAALGIDPTPLQGCHGLAGVGHVLRTTHTTVVGIAMPTPRAFFAGWPADPYVDGLDSWPSA
jgi:hypothetical protein